MDQLRARAYLDILLNKDSRLAVAPSQPAASQGSEGSRGSESGRPEGPIGGEPEGPGDGGSPATDPGEPGTPPTTSVLPAGFTGCINLTVTLPTMLGLADRPGEISGLGPVDPALARDLAHDLAHAAAQNPKTTYCVTVTDQHGHAIGHGCARPEPKNRARTAQRQKPAPPGDHDPPGGPRTGPPGFTFTVTDDHGPSGGYGTWRLSTGLPGQRDLLVTLDPIAPQTCDHRFEASGHDPGVKLRHLTQIRHAT
jgi:hypothetical protein